MKIHSLLVSLFLGVFASTAFAASETKSFKNPIEKLKLNSASGRIVIQGKKGADSTIEANKGLWDKNCKLDMQQNGKTLVVDVKRTDSSSTYRCEVDFKITLPLEADVEIKSGSSDIDIVEVSGKFEVKLGSGKLNIEKSLVKELEARTGSGDVVIDGDVENAELRLGSGDVKIKYNKVPTKGELDIRSGSGNATIRMPKESKISIDFRAGSGKMTTEFDNLISAPYSIEMRSGSGDLKVLKL